MFGFFKKQAGKSEATRTAGRPIISAVLLEGESFPTDTFLAHVAKARFAGKSAAKIERGDGQVFSFQLGDELVVLGLMPAPYPAKDLEGPLATSWMWPKQPPIQSVKRHRSHLLVTMTGGAANAVQRRLVLTAVTALAARQPGVVAVYWPEATLVHFPKVFVEMANGMNSPESPPLYLWVDLRAIRNPDGTIGLFTTGLAPLGHMEIEIPRIDMPAGELREWLLNIMYYLLENGPVLKHGQTIGMSAEQKIRISHSPSRFGHAGKVIRLEP